MNYSNSILPSNAAYYSFTRASMVNGRLVIQPEGSVSYAVDTTVLGALTEHFRVSLVLANDIDNYDPSVMVYVHAKLKTGNDYYYSLTPTAGAGYVYTEEIALEAGEYDTFTFTIYSKYDCVVQLWELCPESTDANAEVLINGVKQSLPKLLYDYNMLPLSVNTIESVIGMITFNLIDATDLQGLLEVSYTASSDCVLTIRIKDIDTTELYTPISYDIKAGRGNIALPHAYLYRYKGLHSTYITAQVSAGILTIDTRGLLYTIDGGYLAEREIDAGISMFDLTLMHQLGSKDPDEIWIVGIDTNECLVRSRPYDLGSSTGFTPKYSLGYAKDAAIEFNGYWVQDDSLNGFTIVTETDPYVFWIDDQDRLYCQHGSDDTTKFLVDTSVSCVSACRGYSSILYPEQDQGLIVLYVKNGVATYRNLCYVDDTRYSWQGPFTIDLEEEVTSAYVHRLNDYRVGFAITTTEHNYLYISSRTYVTQAAPADRLTATYDRSYTNVACIPSDASYDAISVVANISSSYDKVILTFNHPVHSQDPLAADAFSIASNTISVISASIVDDYTVELGLSGKAYLGATISYLVPNCNFSYMPIGNQRVAMPTFSVISPGYKAQETISVAYNNVAASVSMRGIETIEQPCTDTIQAIFSNVVSTVTMMPVATITQSVTDILTAVYSQTEANVTITQTGVSPI